jgi:hypothetical protein
MSGMQKNVRGSKKVGEKAREEGREEAERGGSNAKRSRGESGEGWGCGGRRQ